MHYPFNAFAIDKRRNTIFPKDRTVLSYAKPYTELSKVDVRQTRKMYKCDGRYQIKAITSRKSSGTDYEIKIHVWL